MREFLFGIAEITLGMSLLILLMLILLKLIGGKFTAKCRYILWTLVMIRLAVPFSFGILPALIEVPVEPEPETVQIQIPAVSYTPIPQEPVTVPQQEQLQMPSPPVETPMFTEPEPEPLTWEEVSVYIPHLYLTGTAIFLLWNLLSYGIYTGGIVRSAKPADPEAQRVYETVCRKKELHRPPVLLMSPGLSSPAAFGLLRRRIVLPDIDLSENGLAGTLSHEVTHCKRGDLWIKAFCLLARSFHWFNPLVHLAAFRCEMEMELSCDESVLTGCSEETRAAYGEVMLDIIRRCRRNRGSLTTHFNPKKNAVKARFTNILYGSGKRKGLGLIAVCLVFCLIAGAVVACTTDVPEDETEPESTETPDEPLPELSGSGEYPSMDAYVNERMAKETTAQYYSIGTDGSISNQPKTANVTDTKLTVLEKKGEVIGLSPDGVLECWRYKYLLKLDVPTEEVIPVGGQEVEDDWFDLEGQNGHTVVTLRHPDGTYTILMDEMTGDGLDFAGYRNSYEEAIYDWYVTEYDIDLPLYVEEWGNLITPPEGEHIGNTPVHRFDGDGWGIYIPIQAWYSSTDAMENQWLWRSSYNTGSMMTVDVCSHTLEDEYVTAELQGYTPADRTNRIWELHKDDIHSYYYYYEKPDGGFWRVTIAWTDEGITDYPYIAIEPQVLKLMAESFVVIETAANTVGGRTLVLPREWDDIAVVHTTDTGFSVYEKTANEYWKSRDKSNDTGGYVCSVSIRTKEDFTKTEEHFRTTEGIDVYSEGFGHSVVLGTDAAYVYTLSSATDVPWDGVPDPSEAQYKQIESQMYTVLTAFMTQNGITPNPLCPASAMYADVDGPFGIVDADAIWQNFLNTVVAPYENYIASKEFLDLDGNGIDELLLYDLGNGICEIYTIEGGEVKSLYSGQSSTGASLLTIYSDNPTALAPPSLGAGEYVFYASHTPEDVTKTRYKNWFVPSPLTGGYVLYSTYGHTTSRTDQYFHFYSGEDTVLGKVLCVAELSRFELEAIDSNPALGWECWHQGEKVTKSQYMDRLEECWNILEQTYGVTYTEEETNHHLDELRKTVDTSFELLADLLDMLKTEDPQAYITRAPNGDGENPVPAWGFYEDDNFPERLATEFTFEPLSGMEVQEENRKIILRSVTPGEWVIYGWVNSNYIELVTGGQSYFFRAIYKWPNDLKFGNILNDWFYQSEFNAIPYQSVISDEGQGFIAAAQTFVESYYNRHLLAFSGSEHAFTYVSCSVRDAENREGLIERGWIGQNTYTYYVTVIFVPENPHAGRQYYAGNTGLYTGNDPTVPANAYEFQRCGYITLEEDGWHGEVGGTGW